MAVHQYLATAPAFMLSMAIPIVHVCIWYIRQSNHIDQNADRLWTQGVPDV